MSEMTDAPRPDLTAADWAAMRGRCEAATVGPWDFDRKNGGTRAIRSPGYHGALMCDETYYPWCPDENADWEFIAHARTDLPLALDALARQQEANARLTKDLRYEEKLAAANRTACMTNWDKLQAAEAALADRDATIARLREQWERECADTDRVLIGLGFSPETGRTEGGSLHLGRILAKCVTLEHIQQRVIEADATIARLREFLTSEQARYQAVIDTETVPVTFLHRIRGKRDMCGEALAQLPPTPMADAVPRTPTLDTDECGRCGHAALHHANFGRGECQSPVGCSCHEFTRALGGVPLTPAKEADRE